jgi:hypothetical protein
MNSLNSHPQQMDKEEMTIDVSDTNSGDGDIT